jgi:hypothetical protein
MFSDLVGQMRIGIDWRMWHASTPGRVETLEGFA